MDWKFRYILWIRRGLLNVINPGLTLYPSVYTPQSTMNHWPLPRSFSPQEWGLWVRINRKAGLHFFGRTSLFPPRYLCIYIYILGKSFRPVSVENDQKAESRKHTKNSIFIRSVKNRKSPFSPKNIVFCHFHAHRQTWDFGFSGFPAKW